MARTGRVRVFLGCSLDGCIAGPEHDVAWMEEADLGDEDGQDPPPREALGFHAFMGDIGAMLMGRATHDFVLGTGMWFYGDIPVLVATRRALPEPAHHTVRAVRGDIGDLISRALEAAAGKDVYLDGGDLVRQGLNAGLVDELTLTMLPIVLGDGIRLFDGIGQRHLFRLVSHAREGHDMLQMTLRPRQAKHP